MQIPHAIFQSWKWKSRPLLAETLVWKQGLSGVDIGYLSRSWRYRTEERKRSRSEKIRSARMEEGFQVEGFQDKAYWLHKLESWLILTKFFGIKKYILSLFLHYLFYDFGTVYYEEVQKLQLMPISISRIFLNLEMNQSLILVPRSWLSSTLIPETFEESRRVAVRSLHSRRINTLLRSDAPCLLVCGICPCVPRNST